MKNTIYLLVIFISILIFTGCEELSQSTTTETITTSNVLTTEETTTTEDVTTTTEEITTTTEETTTTEMPIEIQLNNEFETTYEVGSDEPNWLDGVINDDVNVDTSAVDMNAVGSFDVVYYIEDISETLTITIVDTTPPVIYGPNVLIFKMSQTIDLLSDFSVTDNYSENLELTIENLDLSSFDPYLIGEYEIVYSVEDENGNIGQKTVTVHLRNIYGYPDDYSDNQKNAKPIDLNSSVDAEMNYDFDIDYFKITVEEEKQYALYTESNIDVAGMLYDENGNELIYDNDSGHDLNFNIISTLEPGTYYLKINISSRSDGEYTINFYEIKPYFDDNNLDIEIHKVLNIYHREYTDEELLSITELNLFGKNISSIKGLEKLSNLESIKLNYNPITDITPLYDLTNLQAVYLRDTNIEAQEGSDNYNVILRFIENGVFCDIYGDIIQDDYSNWKQDAHEIDVNTTIKGKIDYVNDNDWFRITVNEEMLLSTTLMTGDITLRIYGDEYFHEVLYYPYTNSKAILEPGSYYINISHNRSISFEICDYEVQLEAQNTESIIVTFADANLEQVVRDKISKEEGDIFLSDVAYLNELDASNSQISDLSGIEYLINLNTIRLGNNQITDLSHLIHLPNLDYVFLYHNPLNFIPGGTNDQVLDYFTERYIWCDYNSINYEDDYGDFIEDSTPVQINTEITGEIEINGDVDTFTFSIDEKKIIMISSSTELHGELYDFNNNLIYRGLLNHEIILLQSGDYYLRVYGYRSGTSYPYQFMLIEYEDESSSMDDATFIRINDNKKGFINTLDDVDYYKFNVQEGMYFNIYSSGLGDLKGTLLDSEGNVIATNDSHERGSNFFITKQLNPGVYYIQVELNTFYEYWQYEIYIDGSITQDREGNLPEFASRLALDENQMASLDFPNDVDYYYFILTDTQDILLKTSAYRLDITLYDSELNEINSTISSNLYDENLPSGTYYIKIKNVISHSTTTYDIQLLSNTIQKVSFNDENLENEIRNIINIHDRPILSIDVENIRNLELMERNIYDLTGMEYFINLEYLMLANNSISDLSPLSNLPSLQQIGLYSNDITDITPLMTLSSLEMVILFDNPLIIEEGNSNYTTLQYFIDNNIATDLNGRLIEDDHSDWPESSTLIDINTPKTGIVDYMYDQDYFVFTLETETRLRIHTTGDASIISILYDENLNFIDFDSIINYELPAGTYYLSALGIYGNEYALNIDEVIDDVGNEPSDSVPLESNTTISGSIDYEDDNDYYQITITEQINVNIEISSDIQYIARIYDENMNEIFLQYSTTNNTNFSDVLGPGIYYINVSSNRVGDYQIKYLTITLDDSEGTSFNDALSFNMDNYVSGIINFPSDKDYYQFTLTEDTDIELNLTGLYTSAIIYDGNHEIIVQSDTLDNNLAQILAKLSSGTYFIEIFNRINEQHGVGHYEFNISEINLVEVTFADQDLQNYIRDYLGINSRPIYTIDAERLTQLTIFSFYELNDLTGLQHFINLENLTIINSQVYDIQLLSTLSNLTHLYLQNNQIKDISSLMNLTQLQLVLLNGNPIEITEGNSNYLTIQYFIDHNITTDLNGVLIEDDHSDIPNLSTDIHLGQGIDAEMNYAFDKDYFKLTLDSETFVSITTMNLNVLLTLYDENMTRIDDSMEQGIYKELPEGTYYIEVYGYMENILGSYQLLIDSIIDNEGDDFDTSQSIQINSETNASFDYPGDNDVYQFTIDTPMHLLMYSLGGVDTVARLYNANYDMIKTNDDSGLRYNFMIKTLLEPGTYYLELYEYSNRTGNYTLYIEEFEDDHADDYFEATPIEINEIINGELNFYADEDCFTFTLTEEMNTVIYTTGKLETLIMLYNKELYRIDYGYRNGEGVNGRISVNLPPGKYYIVVTSPSNKGNYQLQLEKGPDTLTFHDYNLEQSIRTQLRIGDRPITTDDLKGITSLDLSNSGIRNLTDIKHFTDLVEINLTGNEITDMTPLLDLPHLQSVQLKGNGLDLGDESIINTINQMHQNGIASDIYGLITDDDVSDTSNQAQSINIGESFSGTLNYTYDKDTFTFTLTESQTLHIDLSGTEDFMGTIYQLDNTIISFTNEHYVILEAGSYYLEVKGRHYDMLGNYQLTMTSFTNQEVTFNNPILEQAIRAQLQNNDQVVYLSDLYNMTELHATKYGITNLTGIEQLINLEVLYLDENQITDISLLQQLTELEYVAIANNPLSFDETYNQQTIDYFINNSIGFDLSEWFIKDDVSNSPENATELNLNTPFDGEISYASDIDWFVFTLKGRAQLNINLTGNVIGELYDENNHMIDQDELTMRVFLHPGTYRIKITGNDYDIVGSYQVNVSGEEDTHGNDAENATPIEIGEILDGAFEYEMDTDYFVFEVGVADTISIYTTGLSDTVGILFDSEFNMITDDDCGDAFNFRFDEYLEPGTYYILIREYGNEVGDYKLHIEGTEVSGVYFKDDNLESLIRSLLNQAEGPILATDLETITTLDAGRMLISDLTGLEYLTNLTSLTIRNGYITDLTPLENLNLMQLNLSGNQISDLTPLSQMTSLETLDLSSNQITDIQALSNLVNIMMLNLSGNQIETIDSLDGLTQLNVLNLAYNNITSINVLQTLFDNGAFNENSVINLYLTNNSLDLSDGTEASNVINYLNTYGVMIDITQTPKR